MNHNHPLPYSPFTIYTNHYTDFNIGERSSDLHGHIFVLYVDVCVHGRVHVCVHVSVCIYVYMCVSMCVCVSTCVCACVSTCV